MATLTDSYSESNSNGDASFGLNNAYAQSFTSDSDASNNLDSAKFYLKKVGSVSGNIVAKLYAMSGTMGTSSVPTGSALATSGVIDVATVTTSYVLYVFTFSGVERYAMAASTNYTITVEFAGGVDVSNTLHAGRDNSSPTDDGNLALRSAGTGTWTPNSGIDLCFYVYENADAPPAATARSFGFVAA